MKECIILAGGFGTRLQSVVSDVPKCMAEVAGHPFLYYLFEYLEKEQFDHIVLSLGYKSSVVIDWLQTQKRSYKVSYVVESTPLGTGGAIKLAAEKIIGDEFFVLNGDTFFRVNTEVFYQFYQAKNADIAVALKPMREFDRYGSVLQDGTGRISHFKEKQYTSYGLINGGVYIINKSIFSKLSLGDKFSFEKDVMESYLDKLFVYGYSEDTYFIDIGIPSDYEKANEDFQKIF
ncbi:MAG: nucleotidyltransferase family protein [Dysgonomonas sp.]|nr:nucleotidyltransferase family protein [Dysgonomonas sp.]